MSPVAPVANFDGRVIHIGRLGRETWNNAQINDDENTDNIPAFVGMGNALKIFISSGLTSSDLNILTDLWINLVWRQRVQGAEVPEGGTAAAEASVVPRVSTRVASCNDLVFADSSVSRITEGDWESVELQVQRIKIPTLKSFEYPYTNTVLTNRPPPVGSIVNPNYTGVIYECIAKADYLWVVANCEPDTFSANHGSYLGIDIAIGSNAQGQQPLISQ